MKIICDKQILSEAVARVSRAVSARITTPALEGILLRAGNNGNSLFLAGYDLELGITTTIEAQVSAPGEIVIPAKQLGEIVRRLPMDIVSISVGDDAGVDIKSGKASYHLVGMPAAEFPDLPQVNDGAGVSLPANILRSMLRQTIFAIAPPDSPRPVQTGALFELDKTELRIVAVDGSRLAMRREPITSEEELRFIVPGKTLKEVLNLLSDEDTPVFLAVGRRQMVWQIDGYALVTRLLDGEFLAYRKVVEQATSTAVKVNTRELTEAVDRVSLVINDRVKSPLICLFKDNLLSLSCATSLGSAEDSLEVTIEGDEQDEIGFNSRFLLEALRNMEVDEITLRLGGAASPMKLLPCGDVENCIFLVLPVRIKR